MYGKRCFICIPSKHSTASLLYPWHPTNMLGISPRWLKYSGKWYLVFVSCHAHLVLLQANHIWHTYQIRQFQEGHLPSTNPSPQSHHELACPLSMAPMLPQDRSRRKQKKREGRRSVNQVSKSCTKDLVFHHQQCSLNSHQWQWSSCASIGQPNNTMDSLETTL